MYLHTHTHTHTQKKYFRDLLSQHFIFCQFNIDDLCGSNNIIF